jgi:hypothetical protein
MQQLWVLSQDPGASVPHYWEQHQTTNCIEQCIWACPQGTYQAFQLLQLLLMTAKFLIALTTQA